MLAALHTPHPSFRGAKRHPLPKRERVEALVAFIGKPLSLTRGCAALSLSRIRLR